MAKVRRTRKAKEANPKDTAQALQVVKQVTKTAAGRKEVTKLLLRAAAMHFAKRGYAVNTECGLLKQGKLRADLFCFTMHPFTVIVEVKSCKADFDTDKKVHLYREYANQVYVLLPTRKLADYVADKEPDYGILYLSDKTGHLHCRKPCSKQEVDPKITINMILRMGYRAAEYTKRNTRRTRVYLKDL
jgi:hypothetical protein